MSVLLRHIFDSGTHLVSWFLRAPQAQSCAFRRRNTVLGHENGIGDDILNCHNCAPIQLTVAFPAEWSRKHDEDDLVTLS